jgi:hypothetical protein
MAGPTGTGKQPDFSLNLPVQPEQPRNHEAQRKGVHGSGTARAYLLLEHEAEAIIRKTIEKAKKGDSVALRLCLERLMPVRHDRPLRFKLRELGSAVDASRAMADITAGVARGDLTPAEAAGLSHVINAFLKALEDTETEHRLQVLEGYYRSRSGPTNTPRQGRSS